MKKILTVRTRINVAMKARYDEEFSSEVFWQALRSTEYGRALEYRMDRYEEAEFSQEEINFLKALPGFSGGPAHAPTALIFSE